MEVSAVVAAPADAVWPVIAEPARWTSWGPSVSAVDCDDNEVRPGTRGRVRTPVGVWLPFVVTEADPGRSWRWRVAGIPATGHRIEPLDGNHSRVVFEIPWWAAPYALVCRRACSRIERLALGSTTGP